MPETERSYDAMVLSEILLQLSGNPDGELTLHTMTAKLNAADLGIKNDVTTLGYLILLKEGGIIKLEAIDDSCEPRIYMFERVER